MVITPTSTTQAQIGFPSTWAATDPNDLTGYLLNRFMQVTAQQFANDPDGLYAMFGVASGVEWKGARGEFAVYPRRDQSFFIGQDNGAIHEGSHAEPVTSRFDGVVMGGAMSLSDGIVYQAGGRMTETVPLIATKMTRLREDAIENLNRELFLDGRGVLAEVSSISTGVVTLPTGDSNQYVYRDQPLQVIASDYTTLRGGGASYWVVGLGETTPTISLSGSKGGTAGDGFAEPIQAGDFLIRRGAYDAAKGSTARNSLIGLDAIVDDGDQIINFQSISRTKYPEWSAFKLTAAGSGTGPLTTLLLHQLLKGRRRKGRGSRTSGLTFITSDAVSTTYSQIFQPAVMVGEGGRLVGGFESLTFQSGAAGSLEILENDACQPDRIYVLDKSSIKYAQRKPLGFRPPNLSERWQSAGSGVFIADPDHLRYSAVMTMHGQLIATRCNSNAVLDNIDVGSARQFHPLP